MEADRAGESIGTLSAGSTPPNRCWSPYGRTMTSPSSAQCGSPPTSETQQLPLATIWKTIRRSAPGRSKGATSVDSDW